MATEVHNPPEQSFASLVSGIVNDGQDLIKQQLLLTRREIEIDLRKTQETALLWVVGMGVMFMGALPLCLMLSHLIHWLASPPGTDPAQLPLWVCHGLVGAVLVGIGFCLVQGGKKKLRNLHPLDQTTEALKENMQWLSTPK